MVSATFRLQGSLEGFVFRYKDAGVEAFLNQFVIYLILIIYSDTILSD